ncbi:MAG TPA: orotidine-5'-phosphate decarboxylase [Pyrinomonadaceae bacterium]|nr:orotidine-5'-phosphate decarboxylase [Pyrinomonadaceae bacterium]
MEAKDKLIVALDVDTVQRALELVERLRDTVGMFKIGMQLFTAAGPDIVRRIVDQGSEVFLDLKYHDIPNTVGLAAVEATRLGVSLFNVHASGGREMMLRTAEAVAQTAAREGLRKPRVLGVTLLTSLDTDALAAVGIEAEAESLVAKLALVAADCGLDGVVASAREIRIVREAVSRSDFLIVTPGIRSARNASDDQRRTMTAADAIRAGADYLVVGRPVIADENPRHAAEQLVKEISEGR